jgi:formamidopyrimidine-DNA glycosylase
MPELPEVEHMTRALGRWLVGARLSQLDALDATLMKTPPSELAALVGKRVQRVWRRAKYSVVQVQGGTALVLHYRMTGSVLTEDMAAGRSLRIRLRIGVDDRPAVLFVDPRRFGCGWVVKNGSLEKFFHDRKLGPDVWPGDHTGMWWAGRLGTTRSAIKVALLDQRRVAGVGNIGATESLWAAGIDPRTPAAQLSARDWDALASAVPAWVRTSLAAETQPELHLVTAGGPNPFHIYKRAGAPCPRCGATIQSLRQSGRSTAWCPSCQTAAAPEDR